MIPTTILPIWLCGLFSFALIGGGFYALHQWYKQAWSYDPLLQRSYFDPHFGSNEATLLLAIAVLLLLWALLGGVLIRGALSLTTRTNLRPGMNPSVTRSPEPEGFPLRRTDGSILHVVCYGPENGPPIVLTHGWGADRTEWTYLRQALSDRFRLIVWDLPGLGRSTRPANQDYSLENLARDLHAVLEFAGGRPALLLGHSIGGMITLTFCRLFPEALGSRVNGLVLVQTTYTNPVRTTNMAALFTALERPVIVPLLHLTIGLAPVVWLMNWLSYLNGSAHLSTKSSGFAGTETWDQIDHISRLGVKAWPGVLARGMFGMLRYDETATLKTVVVPTLVIAGDRDPVCQPRASEYIRQSIPTALLFMLSPAKHMGLLEHYRRFGERVRGFASDCFQSRSAGA